VRCWQTGSVGEAARHLGSARELLDDAAPPGGALEGEQRAVTNLFWLMTTAMCDERPIAETFAMFDELIDGQPDRYMEATVCGFAATAAVAVGAWDVLGRYAVRSRAVDPGAEFGFWTGQAQMHHAIVSAWHGDVDDALARFAQGCDRYRSIGGGSSLPALHASFASGLAAHGRVDDAETAARAARAELARTKEAWNHPIVLMGDASVALARGQRDEGERLAREAETIAVEQGSLAVSANARRLVV
jgi:hypothetical protein